MWTTFWSGSIVGKRLLQCHECCSKDMCNQALCVNMKSSNCTDDVNEDCSKLDSLFHVCDDIPNARLVCPQYCNMCDIVDGVWSMWSIWSECDATCANGTRSRIRYCNDPPPSPRGDRCKRDDRQSAICTKKSCPVHGAWTSWSSWGSCSVSCDIGMQRRDRYCSNPYPSADGDFCHGEPRDDRICLESACANGNWSVWSTWDSCSVTCGTGLQSRHRQCDNPIPSLLGRYCAGSPDEAKLCYEKACTAGGWSDWGQWSTCSITCGGGIRSRSRTCTNPVPSEQGKYCEGDESEVQACNGSICPETLVKPNVLFKARSPKDTALTQGETIIFNNIILNYGDGYNNVTGIFTVPVTGTYLFTAQLCLPSGKSISYGLLYDNNIHTSGIFYGHYATCNTFTAMLPLSVGQRVQIKCLYRTANLIEQSTSTFNYWNSFCGMLIHK